METRTKVRGTDSSGNRSEKVRPSISSLLEADAYHNQNEKRTAKTVDDQSESQEEEIIKQPRKKTQVPPNEPKNQQELLEQEQQQKQGKPPVPKKPRLVQVPQQPQQTTVSSSKEKVETGKKPSAPVASESSSSSAPIAVPPPNFMQQLPNPLNKEAMMQMMQQHRGQPWPFAVLPGGKPAFLEGLPAPGPFPFAPMSSLVPARGTQSKPRPKKRKEKERSPAEEIMHDDSRRMQCWNCSPECPNFRAGPDRHHVAGMCGRCHQRWQKHPKDRWPISRCVSKCRCARCEMSRSKPDQDGDTGIAQFGQILAETKSGQGTTLLHRLTSELVATYGQDDISDITMASIVTLSSLVGVPFVKQTNNLPAEIWGCCFAVIACEFGLPTHVWSCHDDLSYVLGGDVKGQNFMSLVDIASVPFLLACCIQVNITGLPHESYHIKLKNETKSRKLMVRFGGNSDFQVVFSPFIDSPSSENDSSSSSSLSKI